MYELCIANKNYSSWSLRPWILMRQLQIPFTERFVAFGDSEAWHALRELNPAGLVPCLIDGSECVWESIAIVEYLAERHAGVWPQAAPARAWARSAAAEMHAGFPAVREECSLNCGVRVRLHRHSPALQRQLQRLDLLWRNGLQRFGGPWLAGAQFTAVDAFYAPVAFRAQTYGLCFGATSDQYVQRLLALTAMQEWYRSALQETLRDPEHEQHTARLGTVLQDLRRTPAAPAGSN